MHIGTKTRKLIIGVTVIGLLLASLVLAFKAWQYTTSLSDKDFSAIETRMSAVYTNMEVTQRDTSRQCYHYQDAEGDSKTLKCSVSMAGYVDAKNSDELARVAETFAGQLRPLSNAREIWDSPRGGGSFRSGVLTVSDSKLNMGCLVSVKTGSDAARLGYGLPQRDAAGKAVLLMSCGGGSREAYFGMRR
jgi:hypothetical protein